MWSSEIIIGDKKIKNRIVFPPITSNWADPDGTPNSKILKFYKYLAEGGCGMIVVEGTAISPEGKGCSNSLCLYKKEHIKKFAEIADDIKKNNCFSSIQLLHVGGQGNPGFTGYPPIAPSELECKATGFKARELSDEEIEGIRKKFTNSIFLASEAGFDAVEIHLAHGYLLHEFLSEYFNKRKDRYGGKIENRIRLPLEIIKDVKRNSNIILGVRISGEDYVKNGINHEVNKNILPILEDAGIEYFSVTAGIYDTSKSKHDAMAKGEFFDYSRKIKTIVSKPVISAGKVLDLETADRYLSKGYCDMVAIGRGQIADPAMIKKSLEGIPSNRCTECGECQYLRSGKKSLECSVRELQDG
jgi:2,4-dienoyl-CoA reductase-like NADH-dependent reductase (Old Yellow Enzyme family)